MAKAKLIELVNKGEPSYRWDGLDTNQKVSELLCYGFNERHQENWRKIALDKVDKVRFDYKTYKSFSIMPFSEKLFKISGNIATMTTKSADYLNNIKELKFLNYHNVKNFRKYFQEGGGFWDVTFLTYGGLSSLGGGLILGGEVFIAGQLMGELGRRRKIGKEKSKIKELQEGMEKYQNFKEDIQNARIEVYTPKQAVEIIEESRKVKQNLKYSLLDFDKVNKDLEKVYSEI